MIENLVLVVLGLIAGAAFVLMSRRAAPRPPRPDQRLSGRRARIEEDLRRNQEILSKIPLGIVVVNQALVPVFANSAGRRLAAIDGAGLPPRLPGDQLESLARRSVLRHTSEVVELSSEPERPTIRAHAIPLDDEAGVLVVLHDVTRDREAQRLRRQFVLNASHEMKTPVTALRALAEAVVQAAPDDPVATRHLAEKLLLQAERASELTATLLDLSRVEDPSHAAATEVDLSAVAGKLATDLGKTAAARGLATSVDIESDIVVRGDQHQIELMLKNLLDNALTYTPLGGSVRLELSVANGHAVIRVIDTGIGIPLQAQGRVFERFYRVDDDRARASGGTGLGLSIVKHVAESHGGHVVLKSELGEGSAFVVQLPMLSS